MFNDTNAAYLTWNASVTNRRIINETDVNFTGYTPANYFYSEKIEAYSLGYALGYTFLDVISDPRYVRSEGPGNNINKGQTLQTNYGNLNVYQSSSLPVYIKSSYSGTSRIFNTTRC